MKKAIFLAHVKDAAQQQGGKNIKRKLSDL